MKIIFTILITSLICFGTAFAYENPKADYESLARVSNTKDKILQQAYEKAIEDGKNALEAAKQALDDAADAASEAADAAAEAEELRLEAEKDAMERAAED